jgi:photosystem II stability/assembly factor-like uncharacterized protein
MERRSIVCLLFVLACLCALPAAAGSARAAGAPAPQAAWTIALYVNCDNDLMYTWQSITLRALKGIPANGSVNVVALLDTPKKDGAWLYQISGTSVTTVKHYTRERDFGSGATFRWFLEQVRARFPSDHLLVDGVDHGGAWRYFSWDATSDDEILLPELKKAIVDAAVPIDILAFDACNMADADVAYELASTGLVGDLVASEETVDEDGYPYGNMFMPLAGDPRRRPETVLGDMLAGWERYYDSRRNLNWVSLSAVDMAAITVMKPDLVEWVSRLREGLPSYAARYQAAMHRSQYGWDSWQLDLGQFAANLAADPLIADAGLRAASARVRDDVRAAALGVTSGSLANGFTGLTLWAGTGREWSSYSKDYRVQGGLGKPVAAGGTGWYGFLRAFNASGKADRRTPDYLLRLGRPTYGLSDVYFRDAAHGWATGFNNLKNTSFILRTGGSGGKTWKTGDQSAYDNYSFSAIAPAGDGRLWAVGPYGYDDSLIVVSRDGGRTWAQHRSGTVQYLFGVDFPDAAHGWVSGAAGTLLRSGDAGKSWKKVASAPSGDLFALDFTDASHGWVAAGDERYPSAQLQYTSDAGAHWASQYTAAGALLYSVDAVGDGEVWAAGGDPAAGLGTLVHGGLGGAWAAQWTGPARLADVAMVDAAHGWAVGDGGLILHSVDGSTWTAQASGVTFDLTAVTALDAQTAWAVGDGETILCTTDGGAHWLPGRGDVVGPKTRAPQAARASSGGTVTLRFSVTDGSGSVRPTVKIRDVRGRVVKWRRFGWVASGARQRWTFRCTLPCGFYRFSVYAVDIAGNAQGNAAGNVLLVTP